MAMNAMIARGFTERQIVIAAAAFIATKKDGRMDMDEFMDLGGYTVKSTAARRLCEVKAAIKEVQGKTGGGNGNGSDANEEGAVPATPKRKKAGAPGPKSAKKAKPTPVKKTLEFEDEEEDEVEAGVNIKEEQDF